MGSNGMLLGYDLGFGGLNFSFPFALFVCVKLRVMDGEIANLDFIVSDHFAFLHCITMQCILWRAKRFSSPVPLLVFVP